MTAINHALTGMVIALAIKQPAVAIPLAFFSHFILDLVPHYNPAGVTRDTFQNYVKGWNDKLAQKSFRIIFTTDMSLFIVALFLLPFLTPSNISPWVVILSGIAAVAPDSDGGIRFLLGRFMPTHYKVKDDNWFTRLHVGLQWMERPWGVYIEATWLLVMLYLIYILIR